MQLQAESESDNNDDSDEDYHPNFDEDVGSQDDMKIIMKASLDKAKAKSFSVEKQIKLLYDFLNAIPKSRDREDRVRNWTFRSDGAIYKSSAKSAANRRIPVEVATRKVKDRIDKLTKQLSIEQQQSVKRDHKSKRSRRHQ
jgi:hypothetical protein